MYVCTCMCSWVSEARGRTPAGPNATSRTPREGGGGPAPKRPAQPQHRACAHESGSWDHGWGRRGCRCVGMRPRKGQYPRRGSPLGFCCRERRLAAGGALLSEQAAADAHHHRIECWMGLEGSTILICRLGTHRAMHRSIQSTHPHRPSQPAKPNRSGGAGSTPILHQRTRKQSSKPASHPLADSATSTTTTSSNDNTTTTVAGRARRPRFAAAARAAVPAGLGRRLRFLPGTCVSGCGEGVGRGDRPLSGRRSAAHTAPALDTNKHKQSRGGPGGGGAGGFFGGAGPGGGFYRPGGGGRGGEDGGSDAYYEILGGWSVGWWLPWLGEWWS